MMWGAAVMKCVLYIDYYNSYKLKFRIPSNSITIIKLRGKANYYLKNICKIHM